MHNYTAYNLTIDSELPLQGFLMSSETMPEVRIRYGKAPPSLSEKAYRKKFWEAEPGRFLSNIDGVARYYVSNGNEIVVERFLGSTDKDVHTFLLGMPFAALLNQRKNLVLHASGIQTKFGAVLFSGASGSGKSTLMNAFSKQGYAMLSDDLVCVNLDKTAQCIASPAFPRSRLWQDSLTKLDIDSSNLQKHRNNMDKFLLPVEKFHAKPSPVFAIYFLSGHNRTDLHITSLGKKDQLTSLVAHTYRKNLVYKLGNQVMHFKIMASLSNTSKIFKCLRPTAHFLLDNMVEQIEESWNA